VKTKKTLCKVNINWFMAFILLNGCVEPIDFEIPSAQPQTVIEGMISTNPGPYTVKVSKSLNLNEDTLDLIPIENGRIKLYDDQGNVEDFTETSPGIYKTGGIIQGQVGHAYHITLETSDGKIFESEPDMLNPVGEVDSIKFEYEARTVKNSFDGSEVPADVFNILVDAHAGGGDEIYVRWRFKGTFKVKTFPELKTTKLRGATRFIDPPTCSGYIVIGFIPAGKLQKVGECTCCICWASQFESAPQISDAELISGNQFRNVKIAELPINNATFYEKYLVEIEQMSLSREAFQFFKLVRAQKEGASNLFQPPSAEIAGNIKPVNTTEPVIGLFWATSITKKSIFVYRSDVPYPLTPVNMDVDDCSIVYPNSVTEQPEGWE